MTSSNGSVNRISPCLQTVNFDCFFFYIARKTFCISEKSPLCSSIFARLVWQCIVTTDICGIVNREVSFTHHDTVFNTTSYTL